MKLYIAEYYNNSYFGRAIDVEPITKVGITLYDLDQIYKDFDQTPTHIDLISLHSYGRCLIKSLDDRGEKKLIFLIDPIHQSSKSVMRQITLNIIF